MAYTAIVWRFVALVFACMVVAAPYVKASVSCEQVEEDLSPCFSYLVSGGSVPSSCCRAIESLYDAADTTADRQGVCTCLKSVASSMSGINPDYANSLPGDCGLSLGYPISTSVDCSQVQ